MIVAVKIETKVYTVSNVTRIGNKTVRAQEGHVYLQREGEEKFLARWPLRLHGETRIVICQK